MSSMKLVHKGKADDGWIIEIFECEITESEANKILSPEEKDKSVRKQKIPISKELGFAESIDYSWVSHEEIINYEFPRALNINVIREVLKNN